MKRNKMTLNSPVCHFDRVKIISARPLEEWRDILPMKQLKGLSEDFKLVRASKIAREFDYKTQIDITVPQKKCLEILSSYIDDDYKISHLEITKDIPCDSKYESIKRVEHLLVHLKKKYTHELFIYDHSLAVKKRRKIIKSNKNLYADRTGYFGSKLFKFVIYPRISKVFKKPCVHMEWKIIRAGNIFRKTGIRTVNDMIDFNKQEWFNEQLKKYILFQKIDHENHGRFIQGMQRGRKSAGYTWNGKKKANPTLASRIMCRIEKINSPAELFHHYKGMKKKDVIKTPWEKKVLKLTNYKLNSFFKAYDVIESL